MLDIGLRQHEIASAWVSTSNRVLNGPSMNFNGHDLAMALIFKKECHFSVILFVTSTNIICSHHYYVRFAVFNLTGIMTIFSIV